jgi:hypothetical protein
MPLQVVFAMEVRTPVAFWESRYLITGMVQATTFDGSGLHFPLLEVLSGVVSWGFKSRTIDPNVVRADER